MVIGMVKNTHLPLYILDENLPYYISFASHEISTKGLVDIIDTEKMFVPLLHTNKFFFSLIMIFRISSFIFYKFRMVSLYRWVV